MVGTQLTPSQKMIMDLMEMLTTTAKAKASQLLVDYEELLVVQPIAVAYKGKGKAPAKKRKRDDADVDEELTFSGLDEEDFAGGEYDGEDSQ